jgi:hypothetical protein
MKILILHLGTLSETLVATSLIKGILKKIENPIITWVTLLESINYVLSYNKNIHKVISYGELQKTNETFDVVINLRPDFPIESCPNIKIKDGLGFGFDSNAQSFEGYFFDKKNEQINLFQMYYKLAGLIWDGEGYDLQYFPQSKTKKNRIGIAVAHANVRNYVIDKLELESNKLWYIPYKKNIFKRMDEINKCKKIITDDIITLYLALSLRKYVYFLKTLSNNLKIELFGNGQIFEVPKTIIQEF